MRVSRQLSRLEPMVLHGVRNVKDGDWHRAPKGKWSLAQIVGHLAASVDLVATAFERRAEKEGMTRSATPKQQLLRHVVLGVGSLPAGRKTPEQVMPADRPDPEAVKAQFRVGVERLSAMVESWPQERQTSVFVAHPVLGDLNLPEWVRFFYVHCRHYERQLRTRRRWLSRSAARSR